MIYNIISMSDIEKEKEQTIEGVISTVGMNWDESNIKTIELWIKDCNKQDYIYDYALDKIKDRSNYVKLILLILSTSTMLITTSNLGLNVNENITWVYKIFLAVISTLTYGLTSYQKMENFDDTIEKYTRYTDKISIFLANIISISEIKLELRPDGDQYIMENRKIYTDIYRECPYIKQSYWQEGIISYNNYILSIDNSQCSRKRNIISKYINKTSECSEDINHIITVTNK